MDKNVNSMRESVTRCGYIAIMGRANVGKSTLLNAILKRKVTITSRKPQTTRYNILGIKTVADNQFIYVDTPGLQQQERQPLNKQMTKAALSVISDVDLILFVVDALTWKKDDEMVLRKLKEASCPIILVINKVDKIVMKDTLLPHIKMLSEQFSFAAIIPVSAATGLHLQDLEKNIIEYLPAGNFLFPPEQVTDRSDKFFIEEIIREKLTRLLGQELPYALTVVVDKLTSKKEILVIHATILVQKPNQKIIVIGASGEKLKHIGTLARRDLETHFKQKVYLDLWVKVSHQVSQMQLAENN